MIFPPNMVRYKHVSMEEIALAREELQAILGELAFMCGADLGLYFTVRKTREGKIFHRMHVASEQPESMFLLDLDGTPIMGQSVADDGNLAKYIRRGDWTLEDPLDVHLNRFAFFDEDYDDRKRWEVSGSWKQMYKPVEVGDQLRAILYDGDRFAGWLGLWRRGMKERFLPAEGLLLERKSSSRIARLLELVRLIESREQRLLLHLLVEPSGSLAWSSPGVRDLLDHERLSAICALAIQAGKLSSRRSFEDLHLVIQPMYREGELYQVLVTLELGEVPARRPVASLERSERAVVEAIASGLSTPEIASLLGVESLEVRRVVAGLLARFRLTSREALVALLAP